MKTRLRFFAHVLLGGLLSLAFSACAAPAAQPAESTHPAATEAPISPTFAPQGTPPSFPTVVTDPLVIALLAGLKQNGFPTELQDASRVDQLQDAPGQSYGLAGGWLFLHVYADAQVAQARASSLAVTLPQSSVDWVAPPHFFQCGRLIVLYLGVDAGVVGALSALCAPPFYTSSFSLGGPPATPTVTAKAAAPVVLNTAPAAAPTARPMPPADYPLETHQTLSSGLILDEYALTAPPDGDRMNDIMPVHRAWADIVARHQADGGPQVWPDFTTDAQGRTTLTVPWRGQPLLARELVNASPQHLDLVMHRANPLWHLVQVWQAGRSLYLISTGEVSPVDKLRTLLAYNDHWLLEVAYVATHYDVVTGLNTDTVTGQIVQDGVLLNIRDGNQEAFGLQLLRGQPFYFYRQADQIGVMYAGQPLPLGYDEIPHYSCCSNALLNPVVRANMVSFFARRGQTWYYVEIGAYR